MQGIKYFILFAACLVGAIFWLRASETGVSKGFAIFFIVWSSLAVLLWILAAAGGRMLMR